MTPVRSLVNFPLETERQLVVPVRGPQPVRCPLHKAALAVDRRLRQLPHHVPHRGLGPSSAGPARRIQPGGIPVVALLLERDPGVLWPPHGLRHHRGGAHDARRGAPLHVPAARDDRGRRGLEPDAPRAAVLGLREWRAGAAGRRRRRAARPHGHLPRQQRQHAESRLRPLRLRDGGRRPERCLAGDAPGRRRVQGRCAARLLRLRPVAGRHRYAHAAHRHVTHLPRSGAGQPRCGGGRPDVRRRRGRRQGGVAHGAEPGHDRRRGCRVAAGGRVGLRHDVLLVALPRLQVPAGALGARKRHGRADALEPVHQQDRGRRVLHRPGILGRVPLHLLAAGAVAPGPLRAADGRLAQRVARGRVGACVVVVVAVAARLMQVCLCE
jgi:hypothetical protein